MSSIYDPLSTEPKRYLQKINEIRESENKSTYKYLQLSAWWSFISIKAYKELVTNFNQIKKIIIKKVHKIRIDNYFN